MRFLSVILLWALFFLQAPCLFAGEDLEKKSGSAALLSGLGTRLGDVTRDYTTNTFDLLYLLIVLNSEDEPPPSADVDKDGRVNIFDLLKLLQYMAEPPEPDSDFEFLVVIKNRILSGLKIFLPVPPNTSLPRIMPTAIPTAAIQNGMVGGSIIG